jgi:DNA polymerase-2
VPSDGTQAETTRWVPGLILTQEWQDLPEGCLLAFWGRGLHGPFVLRVMARPLFFVPRRCVLPPGALPAERRSLALRDFAGDEADVLYFHRMEELRATRDLCLRAGVPVFEEDVDPAARYLMERFIHGSCEFSGPGLLHEGVAFHDYPRLRPADWVPRLSRLVFDIETGSDGRLYAIAYLFRSEAGAERRVLMLGHGQARRDPPLRFLPTESRLLQHFLADLRRLDPDLLCGWNILGFDLPFLADKCRECGLPPAFGRGGRDMRLQETGGRWQVETPGRVVADGLPLVRGLTPHLDGYSLAAAARALLGEEKDIDFEGLDKQAEIDRLFSIARPRLAAYCLRDVELADRILERAGLIDLMVARSRLTGLPPGHSGRSIAAFDHFFLPRLHRKGRVAPDRRRSAEPAAPLPGGLVLPPRPGLHEHVVVLDFRSLYPSLMLTFSICPYAKLMAGVRPVDTPTGHRFSASEHILPGYIAALMARREQARQTGDVSLARSVKVLMNSFYGIFGAPAARFSDPEIARAIAGSGQWVLRAARGHLEECGYPVLYGDTDSLFVQLAPGDIARPHLSGESLAAAVNAFFREELRERFGATSALELRFDRYYRRLYLPSARHGRAGRPAADEEGEASPAAAEAGAAKRYAGIVRHADGREELQITGMESVRSDWTALARRLQREALACFFRDEPLGEWLRAQVAALRAGACDGELVYRRRLRKPLSAYVRGVPPHVRAARLLPPARQRRLGVVEYVVTTRGPVPVELPHDDHDYDHYLEKQVRPVVEELLALSGQTFAGALSGQEQLRLF